MANAHTPHPWPDLSTTGEYQRLVWLARRRLVGHEHHAEDVVSLAAMKWSRLPPAQRAVGHIEQVIKSEAYSLLRSEGRSRRREQTVGEDRSRPPTGSTNTTDLRLLRVAIAETCRRHRITLTRRDVHFFELLLAGQTLAEAERTMDTSRYEIRKMRDTWRRVLRLTLDEQDD
ncbi:MAG: hypothetical protein AAF962_00020 [Actinomycetota bacterium]